MSPKPKGDDEGSDIGSARRDIVGQPSKYAPPRPTSIEGITACWWGHRARVCCDHGEIFHNIEPAEEVVDS